MLICYVRYKSVCIGMYMEMAGLIGQRVSLLLNLLYVILCIIVDISHICANCVAIYLLNYEQCIGAINIM